jgi:RNA polymerase sigma-70 factor (ECF subfamily)
MDEKYLIESLKNADESAYRQVVESYQLIVYNTCLGMLHDEDSAKDISQDVFIELFRSVHKFRGDSKLSTWLYRIAINKSLNFIRDNKKHSTLKSIQRFFSGEKDESIQIMDSSIRNPQEISEQNDHAIALHKALDTLPINQKTAFVLKNYDDLSYKNISEVMELSISSVESLIHRARVNLQKSLSNYYYEHF